MLAGLSISEVRPINFAAETRVYGVSTRNFKNGRVKQDIFCVSYNCADSNLLTGLRFATTYNNFNNPRNPSAATSSPPAPSSSSV